MCGCERTTTVDILGGDVVSQNINIESLSKPNPLQLSSNGLYKMTVERAQHQGQHNVVYCEIQGLYAPYSYRIDRGKDSHKKSPVIMSSTAGACHNEMIIVADPFDKQLNLSFNQQVSKVAIKLNFEPVDELNKIKKF